VLFSNISSFLDGSLDVLTFGNADADASFFVTDHNERFEAEATTTFDDARDAVNGDNLFLKDFVFGWFVVATWATVVALTTASSWAWTA
jgi:hypothetical protein